MNQKVLVSIIMNCYNGESYLREAIDSVLNQTYVNWELIFWDNQSTDASAGIIKSYEEPRIRYFYAPEHTRLFEARNYAVEKSEGEILAFLDVDDWWDAKKLELQITKFEDKTVGLVCGNYEVFYEDLKRGLPGWKGEKPSGFIANELLMDYHVSMLTILIRRSTYNEVGGFDSRFSIIGDFDLAMRIAESRQIQTVNQMIAHYRIHGANETILKRKLHLEELKIWTCEARSRLPESNLPSLKNLEKNILYLEGQNAADAGDFLILFQKLQQLFPSRWFYKLIIQNIIPTPLLLSVRQFLDKSFGPTRQNSNQ